MKQLFLLRHAKSAWDDPSQGDHDRPLAPRGVKASHKMGLHMKAHGLLPDLVLCSTAKRAAETLVNVMSELESVQPERPPIEHDRGFYLCGWQAWLERIRKVDNDINKLLVVGHNPDMHNLALMLCREGPEESMSHLAGNYPTGALTQIEVDSGTWADIAADKCRLLDFVVPRQLDKVS